MNNLFAIEFELEDFGQNVSHLVRKIYYTYDFFTDRQVYAGITKDFSVEGLDDWIFKRVPCTLAIPIEATKTRRWFSIKNANLKKEQVTGALTYVTEGYQEYLTPGSRFLAFSFLKPDKVLFVGKKGALASVTNIAKVDHNISENTWTSLDLIYTKDYEKYRNKEIFELRLRDASRRFLVGEFKCSNVIQTEYKGQEYKFYTLMKTAEQGMAEDILPTKQDLQRLHRLYEPNKGDSRDPSNKEYQ